MARRKFEWKQGWTEVRERVRPPSSCSGENYRRDTVSKQKGVDGIFCCPRGTKFMGKKRGCFRDGKKAGRPVLQALRHDVKKFAKLHPKIWKKLQDKKPDSKGIRRVMGS